MDSSHNKPYAYAGHPTPVQAQPSAAPSTRDRPIDSGPRPPQLFEDPDRHHGLASSSGRREQFLQRSHDSGSGSMFFFQDAGDLGSTASETAAPTGPEHAGPAPGSDDAISHPQLLEAFRAVSATLLPRLAQLARQLRWPDMLPNDASPERQLALQRQQMGKILALMSQWLQQPASTGVSPAASRLASPPSINNVTSATSTTSVTSSTSPLTSPRSPGKPPLTEEERKTQMFCSSVAANVQVIMETCFGPLLKAVSAAAGAGTRQFPERHKDFDDARLAFAAISIKLQSAKLQAREHQVQPAVAALQLALSLLKEFESKNLKHVANHLPRADKTKIEVAQKCFQEKMDAMRSEIVKCLGDKHAALRASVDGGQKSPRPSGRPASPGPLASPEASSRSKQDAILKRDRSRSSGVKSPTRHARPATHARASSNGSRVPRMEQLMMMSEDGSHSSHSESTGSLWAAASAPTGVPGSTTSSSTTAAASPRSPRISSRREEASSSQSIGVRLGKAVGKPTEKKDRASDRSD